MTRERYELWSRESEMVLSLEVDVERAEGLAPVVAHAMVEMTDEQGIHRMTVDAKHLWFDVNRSFVRLLRVDD